MGYSRGDVRKILNLSIESDVARSSDIYPIDCSIGESCPEFERKK